MALYGISPSLSILLFMTAVVMVQPSATQETCGRYLGPCSTYFNVYDSQVDQEHKVLDGIEAQINYINLADQNNNDQVMINTVSLIPISDSHT